MAMTTEELESLIPPNQRKKAQSPPVPQAGMSPAQGFANLAADTGSAVQSGIDSMQRGLAQQGRAITDTASAAVNAVNRGDPVRDLASGIAGGIDKVSQFFADSAAKARTSDYGQMVPGDRSTAIPSAAAAAVPSAVAAPAAPVTPPVAVTKPAAPAAAASPAVASATAQGIDALAPGTGVINGKPVAAKGYDPVAEAQKAAETTAFWKNVAAGVDERAANKNTPVVAVGIDGYARPVDPEEQARRQRMNVESAISTGLKNAQNAGNNKKMQDAAIAGMNATAAGINASYNGVQTTAQREADLQKHGIDAGIKQADYAQRSKDYAERTAIQRGELDVKQSAQALAQQQAQGGLQEQKMRGEYAGLNDANDPGGKKRAELGRKIQVLSGKGSGGNFKPMIEDDGVGGKRVAGFYNESTGQTTDRYGRPETPPTQAPAAAIEFLKQNPDQAVAFKQKYGYLPQQ